MGRVGILVAEDDASIRALVQLALTKNGYACTTAADGQEAARLIEERRFDLALLDIMLPHIDGYDLLAYLKEYDTPAIFLTAKGSIEDRVHGLRLGAEDYLVKPFAVAELIATPSLLSAVRSSFKGLLDIERVLSRLHDYCGALINPKHPDNRALYYEDKKYNSRKIKDFVELMDTTKI